MPKVQKNSQPLPYDPRLDEKPKTVKHKVTNVLSAPVKVVAGAICVVSLIALSPIFLTVRGGAEVYKWGKIKLIPNSLKNAVETARKTEESEKLEALQATHQQQSKNIPDPLTESLRNVNLITTKFSRYLDRMEARGEISKDENQQSRLVFKNIIDSYQKQSKRGKEDLEINIDLFFDKKISSKDDNIPQSVRENFDKETFLQELQGYQEPEKAAKKLTHDLNALKKALDVVPAKTSEGLAKQNRLIIERLRKALNSDAYHTLKEQIDNPDIQYLHALAAAIWNKPKAFKAFAPLGQAFIDLIDSPPISTTHSLEALQGSDKLSTHDLIKNSIETANHALPNYNTMGQMAAYAIMNVRHALYSMRSSGGFTGDLAGFFLGGKEYDPAQMSNNPSLQGTTTLELSQDSTAKINNVYGGSPTIGDHVAPEYRAVLQAAENQHANPTKRLDGIPDYVTYVNLQNLDKGHEGTRSKAIMALNKEYPLSFRGITLPRDSKFFMKPDSTEITANAFGKQLKKEMTRSFDHHETGHGFYFPGNNNEWSGLIDNVLACADAHFTNKFQETNDKKQIIHLKQAYQEFVQSLLRDGFEAQAAVKATKDGQITNPLVQAQAACKENIDRGGADNTKYLINRGIRGKNLLGPLHGRPNLFRRRTLLDERIKPVLSYTEHVTTANYQDARDEMLRNIDESLTFASYDLADDDAP